jgi:hypothetical protein
MRGFVVCFALHLGALGCWLSACQPWISLPIGAQVAALTAV